MYSKAKNISPFSALVLSIVCLGIYAIFIGYNLNERLLGEGAKELLGIINQEGFFYLHPERIFMFITEILAVIGVQLKLSLPALKFLYNYNLFFVSLIVYGYFIYQKDYGLGLLILVAQVTGLGSNFFTHPFLEHLYSILFCFVLIHLLKQKAKWLNTVVIVSLICLITSFYPSNILFVFGVLWLSKRRIKEKVIFGSLTLAVFVCALLVTEIPVNQKLDAVLGFALEPQLILGSAFFNLEVLILVAFTSFSLYKHSRFMLILYLVIAIIPLMLSGYLPTYYLLLPVGLGVLYIYSMGLHKRSTTVLVLVVIGVLSLIKISLIGKQYSQVSNNLSHLISELHVCNMNKLIINSESSSAISYHNIKEISIDEHIRHAVLLMSADSSKNAIWIESFDFNQNQFGPIYREKHSNYNEEELINDLYIEELVKTPAYIQQYEYNKFYFTVNDLNSRYFEMDSSKNFININECTSFLSE